MPILKYTAFIFGLLLVLLNVNLMRQYQEPAPAGMLIKEQDANNDRYYILTEDGSRQFELWKGNRSNQGYIWMSSNQVLFYISETSPVDYTKHFYLITTAGNLIREIPEFSRFHTIDLIGFLNNGKHVLYYAEEHPWSNASLNIMSFDGSHSKFLAELDPHGGRSYISKDETWVYFSSFDSGSFNRGLTRLNLKTFQSELLASDTDYAFRILQISPDNQWLLYEKEDFVSMNNDVHRQLFRMRVDGTQQQMITEIYGGSYNFQEWDRDSDWVFIRQSYNDYVPTLLCVNMVNATSYEIGDRFVWQVVPNMGYVYQTLPTANSIGSALFTQSCDDRNPVQLTEDLSNIVFEGYLPEKNWILYSASNADGDRSLYGNTWGSIDKILLVEHMPYSESWSVLNISSDHEWVYYRRRKQTGEIGISRINVNTGQHENVADYIPYFPKWVEPFDPDTHADMLTFIGGVLMLASFIGSVFLYRKRARIA